MLLDDVIEEPNVASYANATNFSFVNITPPTGYTADQTKIKITSDSEALEEYNNGGTPKETGHGFSIDANRDASHIGSCDIGIVMGHLLSAIPASCEPCGWHPVYATRHVIQ